MEPEPGSLPGSLIDSQDGDVMTSPAYENSREHLLAHLARLDLLIRAYVSNTRSSRQADNDFKGLYISESEVDALLQQKIGVPSWWHDSSSPQTSEMQGAMDRLSRDIDARTALTKRNQISLRLDNVCESFQLTPFDRDALLLALAPELDVRYERLYAYLQDDITRKKPSVDLILNLLCMSVQEKLQMRARFSRSAPLIRFHLIRLVEDPSYPNAPLLSQYVKGDERTLNHLLGFDDVDTHLLAYAQPLTPRARYEDLHLPPETKQRLTALASQAGSSCAPFIFYFQGGYGVGKQSTAEGLCQILGLDLLIIDFRRLIQADQAAFETILERACREAVLRGAALYWRDFDKLLTEDKRLWLETFMATLETFRGLTFLAGTVTWEPVDALRRIPFIRIPFERPGFADRVRLWEKTLSESGLTIAGLDSDSLANKFHLSGGQIEDSMMTAHNLALFRDPDRPQPEMSDFVAACRLQSQRKLSTLARKIQPHYTWNDIVLPADRLQQLREICNQAKHRALVYEQWGFDKKLSLGKGLTMLFAGPSGTGKTMAADILAHELALDLYKIDLSMVVSKYIGETEKNLASIFNEAAHSNAILFFDEADALFGKRSEVRDAHDRYANIEVGYLLQKMEEYEGIVILATNLRKNMDDAFVRRMQSTVEFPFPSTEDRLRIWQGVWPLETPRNPDLNLDFMAQQFELSGGHIRNIALAATFLAAEDQSPVSMNHLLAAARREYQKIGKVVMEGDFNLPEVDGER
jgi:ATP-dependent 26S proteasome regulatory subunit